MSTFLDAAAIERLCLPSNYLNQIFKSYASDYVATDYMLGLISQFVLAILNGPQSQDQDYDSFLAAQKHVYMGQVYTCACTVKIKQAMLSLPLNDLAGGVEKRLREARQLDGRSQLHAVLDWIVACATHAAVDFDGEVGSVLKLHFRRQPMLGNPQNNLHEHLEQLRMTGPGHRHGTFPALTHVLRRILKEEPSLQAASRVCDMLRAFIQLAMDATEASLVGRDFSMVRENHPDQWADTMQHGLEWVFYVTIKDPAHPLALSGRYMLLEQNYKGLISFLLWRVNSFLARKPRDTIHYEMYKWVIRSAIDSSTGLESAIRPIIEQNFEMPWLAIVLTDDVIRRFRPQHTNSLAARELLSRFRRQMPRFEDEVPIKPTGPPKDPRHLGAQTNTITAPQLCTICQINIEDGEEYIELRACGHLLHLDCADGLINQAYPDAPHVLCPNCRAPICKARDYIAAV